MDVPKSPVDENPCTQEGLDYLRGRMDYEDRQATIEDISVTASKGEKTNSVKELKDLLDIIRGLCSEFI